MRRLAAITLSALVVLAVVAPQIASARRRATFEQRANMTPALGRYPGGDFGRPGHRYHYLPPICARAWISTVNRTWASIQTYVPTSSPGCEKYAGNGIAILHVEHHRWHAVSAGSAFRCPIISEHGQPSVPRGVVRDLISRRLQCD